MNQSTGRTNEACRAARRAIDASFDEAPSDSASDSDVRAGRPSRKAALSGTIRGDDAGTPCSIPDVEDHLASCGACRRYRDDMLRMREALRALPVLPMPEGTWAAVLARTVGGDPAGEPWRRSRIEWGRPLATAAAVAFGVLVPWFIVAQRGGSVPRADVDRAVFETRCVLDVVAGAVNRAERAAVDDVLAKRLVPVARRASIVWSNLSRFHDRRSGT